MSRVLNDLYDYDGMKIFQDNDKFKFSLDSILLAEFVDINKSTKTIVDFCTGNAPVPLILSTKCDAKIIGFEIQKYIFDLGKDSIKYNKLDHKIDIINDNFVDLKKYIESESIDAVTCNPPYFKYKKDSIINEDDALAVARHEIKMNLEDIMISARYVLKNKAPLYLVHRCDRLEEIIVYLNKYGFAVKELQFVYSGFNKEAIMVLVKATKNGNIGNIKVNKPINILEYKSYKGLFEKGD